MSLSPSLPTSLDSAASLVWILSFEGQALGPHPLDETVPVKWGHVVLRKCQGSKCTSSWTVEVTRGTLSTEASENETSSLRSDTPFPEPGGCRAEVPERLRQAGPVLPRSKPPPLAPSNPGFPHRLTSLPGTFSVLKLKVPPPGNPRGKLPGRRKQSVWFHSSVGGEIPHDNVP